MSVIFYRRKSNRTRCYLRKNWQREPGRTPCSKRSSLARDQILDRHFEYRYQLQMQVRHHLVRRMTRYVLRLLCLSMSSPRRTSMEKVWPRLNLFHPLQALPRRKGCLPSTKSQARSPSWQRLRHRKCHASSKIWHIITATPLAQQHLNRLFCPTGHTR